MELKLFSVAAAVVALVVVRSGVVAVVGAGFSTVADVPVAVETRTMQTATIYFDRRF